LPIRLQAKALLQEQDNIDHEYLSIVGLPEFTKASAKLIFGADSPAIKENRCAQSSSYRDVQLTHVFLLLGSPLFRLSPGQVQTIWAGYSSETTTNLGAIRLPRTRLFTCLILHGVSSEKACLNFAY
jgi:hypothetical protein